MHVSLARLCVQAREHAEQLSTALDMALEDLRARRESGTAAGGSGEDLASSQTTDPGTIDAPKAETVSWEEERAVWQRMETELERQVGFHGGCRPWIRMQHHECAYHKT